MKDNLLNVLQSLPFVFGNTVQNTYICVFYSNPPPPPPPLYYSQQSNQVMDTFYMF